MHIYLYIKNAYIFIYKKCILKTHYKINKYNLLKLKNENN